MMRIVASLIAGALGLGVASGGTAGPLSVSGTLSVQLHEIDLGDLPPMTLPSNGSLPVFVSSGSGGFTLPAAVFGPGTKSLPATLMTGIPQISGLTLVGVGNGLQTVSCGAGCAGVGGLGGTAVIDIIQTLNLSIPLSAVGQPGAVIQRSQGSIGITVTGQGWTTGTAVVGGVGGGTRMTILTRVGSDNRTEGHQGTLVLVSGFRITTNVAGVLGGFATQTLAFAPEPAGWSAIAAAVALACICAAYRRR